MADGLNKVQLIGNLGKDPEHRVTQNNKDVTTISVGTSESWKGQDGNRQQKTEWHKVIFWGQQAIAIRDYFKKGSKIYIEGKITTRKWQDNNSNDRYSTEIVANKFLFLDSKPKTGQQDNNGYNNQGSGYPTDDDIPF